MPDPNKLAELNALAQGGSAGLASYQAANQDAQAAQANAISQAANYGTANYNPGAAAQASAGQTASQLAAPGMAAVASGLAAAPGLDALDQSAVNTYTNRTNQNIQTGLAQARQKLALEQQADTNDMQNKLAELALQRQQSEAEQQHQLGMLGVEQQQLALSPNVIAGQAYQRQQSAEQAAGDQQETAQGNSVLAKIRGAVQQGLVNGLQQDKAAAPDAADQFEQNLQGQETDSDRAYAQQLRDNAAQGPQIDAAIQRLAALRDASQGQANVWDDKAAEAAQLGALASQDLPRFQFQAAVDAGMNPESAAGKYLTNENQAIYEKQMQQFNQDNINDRLTAREDNIQADLQRRQDQAQANDLADKVGIPANVLTNAATATRIPFKTLADLITSDEWKKVDDIRSQLGKTDGQGNVFGGQEFANALTIAANHGDIDQNAADLAMYLYSPDARLASQAAAYQNANGYGP